MLVDDGLLTREGDRWVASPDLSELPVPSTIHALLAARLEGLPADERAILTTAAVEGAVFHRSAVAELARPALDSVLEDGLLALVRRDLIRRDAPDFAGEEAYRFRHVLIRDAAYRSLSKNARADLHERFAAWLELTAEERLREFEEIVGYHLEQAFQYRVALGVARLARRLARRPGVPRGSRRRGGGHSSAATCPRRSACSSGCAGLLAADDPRRTRAARRARRRADRVRPAGRGRAGARRGGAAGCRRERRARGVARARPAAVPPAPPRRGGRDRGSRAGRGPGDPGIRALRGRSRPVPRAAARGVAVLERGARRGGGRGVGARGRACAPGGGSACVRRDPDLDRVLALVRSDTGRGGHPPLRGDARGGAREPGVRGGDPPPPGRSARDGRPLRARPPAARDEQRRLRRPRAHAQRGDLPERGRRRAARRQSGCGRGEPAQGVSRARGDGRAHVPLDNRCVPRAGGPGAGARRGGRGLGEAERPTGRERRSALADPLARRSCARARAACGDSRRPRRSRARRWRSPKRPTSSTTGRTRCWTWRRCSRAAAGATRHRGRIRSAASLRAEGEPRALSR